MKLAKSQEKKVSNVSTRRKEAIEVRLDSLSASLVESSTSTGCSLAEMLSHNESKVQMWNTWKLFPENLLWTCVDFQTTHTGPWGNCPHCAHHARLKSSCTDTDLLHSWVSLLTMEMYHLICLFALERNRELKSADQLHLSVRKGTWTRAVFPKGNAALVIFAIMLLLHICVQINYYIIFSRDILSFLIEVKLWVLIQIKKMYIELSNLLLLSWSPLTNNS